MFNLKVYESPNLKVSKTVGRGVREYSITAKQGASRINVVLSLDDLKELSRVFALAEVDIIKNVESAPTAARRKS